MTDTTVPGPAWVPAYLAALAETGQVKQAMAVAGVSKCAVYHQRKTNLLFAEAWQARLPPRRSARRVASQPAAGRMRNSGWRARFLAALAETSNVRTAAARSNVPPGTVYRLKRDDPAFAAGWAAALREGYDHLEMELLGYLRDPQPERKMDVVAALRLLAAHRETVERQRVLSEEEDEQATIESLDAFIEQMRQRRLANSAILLEAQSLGEDPDDGRD